MTTSSFRNGTTWANDHETLENDSINLLGDLSNFTVEMTSANDQTDLETTLVTRLMVVFIIKITLFTMNSDPKPSLQRRFSNSPCPYKVLAVPTAILILNLLPGDDFEYYLRNPQYVAWNPKPLLFVTLTFGYSE